MIFRCICRLSFALLTAGLIFQVLSGEKLENGDRVKRQSFVDTASAPTPESIMDEALAKYTLENQDLQARLTEGADNLVADFKTIKPPILGSGDHGFSVTWIARQSRFINWISNVIRKHNVPMTVDRVLQTWLAKFRKIYCPYFGPSTCFRTQYRTIDGTCNNIHNPLWGRAFTPLRRVLPAVYERQLNTVDVPRHDLTRKTGVNGAPLPSARLVSNVVHPDGGPAREAILTMEYTAFGQFLAHDFTDTPMESGFMDSKLGCCNQTEPTRRCDNIPLPQDDVFRQNGRTCFGFVRSTEGTDINCKFGQREQLNVASSYIDATSVYGHNEYEARKLRTFTKGKLLMSESNELSFQAHPNKKAFAMGINFLRAGDEKVSEFVGLVGITTVFFREHNRIAELLAAIHPYYNDEKLYQETRRILIAKLQHIVYSEYLPVTISQPFMDKYNLNLLPTGYYTGYNPKVDATLTNVFATAAFRFGHSMVTPSMNLVDKNYKVSESKYVQLKKTFFRPSYFLLNENGLQRGLMVDPSEQCDRFMAPDLRDHLFETANLNGFDLAALNIQRGRDHGLPSYNAYRKKFGLNEAIHWSTDPYFGFADMRTETVEMFKKVYESPADVDIWTGGIAEIPVEGGAVGPLFTEIMAAQFRYLRDGDRFWFENAENGFTEAQLQEIRRTTSLAKLICDNVDVETIQPRVFELATKGGTNDLIHCSKLPIMNLGLW